MKNASTPNDAQLKAAVMAELAWTPDIDNAGIGVSVHDGAVTLSGDVDSYPQRHYAERAALRVRGVTAVAEDIKVRTVWGDVSDGDIASQAVEAIQRAVDVPEEHVQAVVNDGRVTLSGAVEWNYQRSAAERSIRFLKGVTAVNNAITLKPKVSTAGIKDSISAALMRSAENEGKAITVTSAGGAVTLTGTVHSASERNQAVTAAWGAPGVTLVNSHLHIAG